MQTKIEHTPTPVAAYGKNYEWWILLSNGESRKTTAGKEEREIAGLPLSGRLTGLLSRLLKEQEKNKTAVNAHEALNDCANYLEQANEWIDRAMRILSSDQIGFCGTYKPKFGEAALARGKGGMKI